MKTSYGTQEEDALIYEIIGAAMEVYNTLGPGLLESVYQKAMERELELRHLHVDPQCPVEVLYKGVQVGEDLKIDLLVEKQIVVELKSVENLLPVHYKQARTYMKLMKLNCGVLINFNEADFAQGYKVLGERYFHVGEMSDHNKRY